VTIIFVDERDYLNTEALGAYVRCIVSLSAITFLALRSKHMTDKLLSNETYLVGAQRLSQVGGVGFRVDLAEMFWSAETARIFECPLKDTPNMLKVLARTHPDDRHLAEAVRSALKPPAPFSSRAPFADAGRAYQTHSYDRQPNAIP
jgi:hypothetical protein